MNSQKIALRFVCTSARPRSLTLLALLGVACGDGTAPDFGEWPLGTVRVVGSIAFGGHTEAARDSITVQLQLENRGTDSARVEFGSCAFAVQARAASGASWDNRLPPGSACIDILIIVDLASGESEDRLVLRTAQQAILGDSLPPDRYSFSIFYRPSGQDDLRSVDAGETTLGTAG